jgi:hypothetical protein
MLLHLLLPLASAADLQTAPVPRAERGSFGAHDPLRSSRGGQVALEVWVDCAAGEDGNPSRGRVCYVCPSPLNVLKYTYDHSGHWARLDEYLHLMSDDSPTARQPRNRRSAVRHPLEGAAHRAGRAAIAPRPAPLLYQDSLPVLSEVPA